MLRIKMELEGPQGSFKTTTIEAVIKSLNGLPPKENFCAEFWTRQNVSWQLEAMAVRVDGVYSQPSWPTPKGILAARQMAGTAS